MDKHYKSDRHKHKEARKGQVNKKPGHFLKKGNKVVGRKNKKLKRGRPSLGN